MEAETIVYYHPMIQQPRQYCAAKRHWWQDAILQERILPPQPLPAAGGKNPFTLVDCPVPPFVHKRKAWKPAELSEAMESVLHRVTGMADAYLHPQIMTILSEMYKERWETCRETTEMLLGNILSAYGAWCLREQGQATVLLGAPEDTEWQMSMTWRLLEPYLDRVNKLIFYYIEREETDVWEELSVHLEQYYYEYGLVPQLLSYQKKEEKGRGGARKSAGIILDYGGSIGCIRTMPDKPCVYIDMTSCPDKERAYARKVGQILYVSPLNYLDTMVKNSYDRLVH